MGNAEVHDLAPMLVDQKRELDLSRKVSYKQFMKHVKGDFSEACLSDIPWNIRDSVWLYEKMDISFNLLTQIPVELPLRLPHLNHVDLSYNQLMSLPESFGLLFHLKTVLLKNNKLTKLPISFTRLVKLEKLDISENLLRELPEDIGRMESLSRLNVCSNKLKKLPISLGLSQTLTVILTKHNRLETPSQSICDEGSEATLKFLRQLAPPSMKLPPKPSKNVFPRVRGNQLQFSNPNPHSAIVEYMETQTNTTNTASRIKTPLLPPLDSSALDVNELRDKILGLIYGAAIGDAIGISTQWMTPDECHFHYKPETMMYADTVTDKHRVHWKRGDWVNNFDQTALVLDSLVHWAGVVDELDFAKSLHNWSCHGFQELGDKEGVMVSDTIHKVVNSSKYLDDPHSVARKLSDAENQEESLFADNGALARSLILGVPQFHNLEEVASNAARICKSTHSDPRAVASSVMLAVTVALMLQGHHNLTNEVSLTRLIEKARDMSLKYLTDPDHCKQFSKYCAAETYASLQLDEAGKQSYALKTIGAALVSLHLCKDFRSTLTQLIMLGADSSTNGCIAGGLLGCCVGYANLPLEWVEGLRRQQVDWLNVKVNLLLDMMGIP